MLSTRSTLACALCLALAACGGSSGSGSGDGMPADGGDTAGGTGGTGGGGTTDGGTDGMGGTGDTADLVHGATAVPREAIETAGAALVSTAGRARAEALDAPLGVVYEVIENHSGDHGLDCTALGARFGACSVTNLHLKDADGALADGGWRLYFHSLRRIVRADSDDFVVSFVNGDLYYLEPAAGFDGFDGPVETLRLVTEFSWLVESDFLPRYWLVRDDGEVTLLPNTDEESDEREYAMAIAGDNRRAFNGEPIALADPATRFAANADLVARAALLDPRETRARIVPAPREITVGTGDLDVSGGLSFGGTDVPAASVAALEARQRAFLPVAASVPLAATLDASLAPGSYTLDVTAAGIAIRGADEEALFHGAQSLLSLVEPGVGTIPHVSVSDAPRFAWRGMHTDLARNFHDAGTLRRLIDQMAAYKLNRLHLHLSDDEGWRLEIPDLPELTAIGARRVFRESAPGAIDESAGLMPQLGSGPFDDTAGTGFLSRAEFVELLGYAAARHVAIVPEFDMPAHARAAVVAMRARAASLGAPRDTSIRLDDPEDDSRYRSVQFYDDNLVNPCVPGTYAFVETLVGAVKAMYDEAGVALDVWHMGGDEAGNIFSGEGQDRPWARSPACSDYIGATAGVDSLDDLESHFVERVATIVADAGIPALHAWHEILDGIDASALATERAGATFWTPLSNGDAALDALSGFAERGFETVLASPDFLYFDFPEEVDPEERGQYWATRFSDVKKVFSYTPGNPAQTATISTTREGQPWSATANGGPAPLGMQGQLWSEVVRTSEQFDYMAFPRLLALAERAWHRAGWERENVAGESYASDSALVDREALADDYAAFAAALGRKELAKLDAAGVRYRIPVPGASTAGGALEMNVAFPGLPLEYSIDGERFTPWQPAASPASAQAVRARSADGTRTGRADAIE